MGEYADYAIDDIFAEEGLRQDYRLDFYSDEEAYEMGILEEHGYEFSDVDYYSRSKGQGPGKCPKCGKETVLRNGKFGEFYGCINFPKCKGSRNL